MIFQATHQQVLNGTKTQTRRVVKPGEKLGWAQWYELALKTRAVINANGCVKWQVGKTYAVQPGRGKRSLGRTPPIKEIRCEKLQEISIEDIYAEGTLHWVDRQFVEMYAAFIEMWNSIHGKGPHDWASDPDVWVLDFELAEKALA